MNASEEQKRKWREDKRLYRTGRREVHLTFTKDEANALEIRAKERKKKLPEYIKEVLDKQSEGAALYLTEETIQTLVLGIRRIGTNVNQCVRHINASGTITHNDLAFLRNQLNQLEALIAECIVSQSTIEPLLRAYLLQYPDRRMYLLRLIETNHDNKIDTR